MGNEKEIESPGKYKKEVKQKFHKEGNREDTRKVIFEEIMIWE